MQFSKIFLCLLFLLFSFLAPIRAQVPSINFDRTADFDVQNYIIRVSFDFKKKKVYGETTVQLKPTKENLTSFELDAVDLLYDSVKLEPDNQNLRFSANNSKIQVTLDKAYSPKDLISVRFKYSTTPAKGVYFVEARMENGVETRSSQIWSQNEAEDARYWFPSFDFPGDKATTEEFITVQKDQMAIGNGTLIDKKPNADGTVTFHYKMPIPYSTYLTSFVVGKYAQAVDTYKNIPLTYNVYPSDAAFARRAFAKTPDIMRVYEELTGINFPYPKYDQTIVANFKFGGMENVTATTISDRDIYLINIPAFKNMAEDLVSHELAHSWFGDLVTCRNWANLWLNEGFATFMEAAYREKMYGRAAYLAKLKEDTDQFFADEQVNKNRHALYNTIADPNSDDLFDITTYKKGGLVIHMLRQTVGETAFWKGINVYLNRFKYANVEYKDLQNVMEETSGQKLDWFFDQWVKGAGSPVLSITQSYNPTTRLLKFTINQTQPADGITPQVFSLPLEVEITSAKGVKFELLNIKNRQEVFTIKLEDKPTKISFDKDSKIPLKTLKVQNLIIEK